MESGLSVGAAHTYVTALLEKMTSMSSGLTESAQSAIAELARGTTLTAPFVAVPQAPAMPGLSALPQAPAMAGAAMADVAAPDAPVLESLSLPDVSLPIFAAVQPEVSIPAEPELSYPQAPGDAPTVAGVEMPDDPDITLPDPPALSAVAIPDFAGLTLPSFEGERPDGPDIEAPGRVFAYSEGVFEHPLQRALEEQVYADLLAGGDIEAVTGITAGIDEIESVNRRILRRKVDAIRDGFAARGQFDEDGPAQEQIRLAELEYADNVRESASRLVVERCRMTMEHRRFLMERGVNYVGILLEAFNQAAARSLEAAKTTAEFLYRDCEVRVQVHNLALARYQADIALWETRFKAAQLALDERRSELEAARLAGDLRRQDVDIYVAECQALQVTVEVFKARVQAAIAKLQGQVEQVQAYEARVRAYETSVNAQTARVNAYIAQIGAQEAKVKIFGEQVRAFAEEVAAQKTVADVGVARADIVAKRNQSLVSLYAAQSEQYRARVQQAIAAVEATQKEAQNAVALYEARVRGTAAENEALRGSAALDVQMFGQKLTAALEQAKIDLQAAVETSRLSTEAIKASGSIAAQVAASSLAGVHGSATVSFSGSNANQFGQHYSATNSTSNSVTESHVYTA